MNNNYDEIPDDETVDNVCRALFEDHPDPYADTDWENVNCAREYRNHDDDYDDENPDDGYNRNPDDDDDGEGNCAVCNELTAKYNMLLDIFRDVFERAGMLKEYNRIVNKI